MTLEEFKKEARRRFGDDSVNWEFVCPRCKTVQTAKQWRDLGIAQETIQKQLGYSCIGRHIKGRGCDWTLGGLLQIHELEIIDEDGKHHPHFDFSPELSGFETEWGIDSYHKKKKPGCISSMAVILNVACEGIWRIHRGHPDNMVEDLKELEENMDDSLISISEYMDDRSVPLLVYGHLKNNRPDNFGMTPDQYDKACAWAEEVCEREYGKPGGKWS